MRCLIGVLITLSATIVRADVATVAAANIGLDLNGVKQLALAVQPVRSDIAFCHGDSGDLRIPYDGTKPPPVGPPPEPIARPGHGNDADRLVVSPLGWGSHLHPNRLTIYEQYTDVSFWCLLSAPLLIGCDLTPLDPFTLNLLANDDVISVKQDPLDRQAARVWQSPDGVEARAKPLADGLTVVGRFDRGGAVTRVSVKWTDLHWVGKQQVRDLWRQQDVFAGPVDGCSRTLPRHGCVLLKAVATP